MGTGTEKPKTLTTLSLLETEPCATTPLSLVEPSLLLVVYCNGCPVGHRLLAARPVCPWYRPPAGFQVFYRAGYCY